MLHYVPGFRRNDVFKRFSTFYEFINIKFPDGTPAEATLNALDRMDEALSKLNEETETRSGDPLVQTRLSILGMAISDMGGRVRTQFWRYAGHAS